MSLCPVELKQILEKLHRFATQDKPNEFEEQWRHLEEVNDLQKAKPEDMDRYFALFSCDDDILQVFKKIVKAGDKLLIGFFFVAALIDEKRLVASLYPEEVDARVESSLFYKCIKYDIARQEQVFLDLLFERIPDLELPDFIETFKALYILTLEGVNERMAQEMLVYLSNKNHLDLYKEVSAHPGEKLWRQALFLQIISLIFYQQELSEDHVKFLKKYKGEELVRYVITLIDEDEYAADEIRNLLNNALLRESLGQRCQEIDRLFYHAHLETRINHCQKEMKTLAMAGDWEAFEKIWGEFVGIYWQDQEKIIANFDWQACMNTVFKQAIKGGNVQIVKLLLDSGFVDIDYFYANKRNKNRDEPWDKYTALTLATFTKNEAMVMLLLDRGAALNAKPQQAHYSSPLAVAIKGSSPSLINLFLKKGSVIWDKKQDFFLSPIFQAIVVDFHEAKESARYLNLLFAELNESSKSALLKKFKATYLQALLPYSEKIGGIAHWTFNFLLNKFYFSVEEFIGEKEFYTTPVFLASLLEKVLRLNLNEDKVIPVTQLVFLKNNQKMLSKIVYDGIAVNLFSPLELERLLKQSIIFDFLTSETQVAIKKTCELNAYKGIPLTVAVVENVVKILTEDLESYRIRKGDSRSKSSKSQLVARLNFYHEIKHFFSQILWHFDERAATTAIDKTQTELDTYEIETLLQIIEDFKREMLGQEASGYIPICQFAIQQLCATSTLNMRTKKTSENVSETNTVEILPAQYQEKLNQIKIVVDAIKGNLDGKAVLAFIQHLITDQSKIEQFFIQKYSVYGFKYNNLKEYTIALHTENIQRGNLEEFRKFIDRLIREYIAAFDTANAAGKAKEFCEQLSGLCIEGRLRGCQNWLSTVNALPRFQDVMKKALDRYNAYTIVMHPDVVETLQDFNPGEDPIENITDVTQASEFISNRVVGTPCVSDEEVPGGIITAQHVEAYLKDILCFSEENPFVLISNPPTSKFEEVALSAVGQAPDMFKQTKEANSDLRDPRLNPTQLNNLVLSYVEGPASKVYDVAEGSIDTDTGNKISTQYKALFKEGVPPIFIFQLTRDTKEGDRNQNLAYINNVIEEFLKKHPRQNGKLLIPMIQGRSQLVRKKQHSVLVEMTIESVKKEITIHNSQSKRSTLFYFNCLNDLKGVSIRFRNYGCQIDGYSCGLFVYTYIGLILEGKTEQLSTSRVSLTSPLLSLENIITTNFRTMKFNAREVKESAESFSWQKDQLIRELDKDYEGNLERLGIGIDDLPEDSETKINAAVGFTLLQHGIFRASQEGVVDVSAESLLEGPCP